MTEEEVKGLRAGDRVLIPATISKITSSGFTAQSACGIFLLHHLDIHSVLPRPLEVGDRVGVIGLEERLAADRGEIVAIADGIAWVRWDVGAPCLQPVSDLERL